MATQSVSSLLSAHHHSRKDREEKDDPRSHVTIPYIQGVLTRILSDINVQVPSGHLGEFSPIQKIVFLMMTSPVLCTRSIFVTVMLAI